MNTSLLGIKPSMFGQAKHTFRTGAVWNAHLECVMVAEEQQVGLLNTAFIFIAQTLIFSGCKASMDITVGWRVLVLFNPSNFGKIQQDLWVWSHKHVPKVDFLYNTASGIAWRFFHLLPRAPLVWAHFLFYPSLVLSHRQRHGEL